jgi:protein-S-isoprenylcysteine O-methyltransferase Ste14
MLSTLVRAAAYAALFIGFVLVFVPARLLAAAGVVRPDALGPAQVVGILVVAAAASLALWCIALFATEGRGTPAPFDPPRRLAVRGPYRTVRNPIYLAAVLALAGAALFYETWVLWAYAGGFLVLTHLFVVVYEEPALRRSFGDDYASYCRRVPRWLPWG